LARAHAEANKVFFSEEEFKALADSSREHRARDGVNDIQVYEAYERVARVHGLAVKAACMTGEEEVSQNLRGLEEELRAAALNLTAAALKASAEQIVEDDEAIAAKAEDEPAIGGRDSMKAAMKLSTLLETALRKGVLLNHDSIKFARATIVNLKGESIRREAKAMIHASEEVYRKQGYIPDAATNCADKVEHMINLAVEQGIPRAHPKLTAAWNASKELREQEGWRKREANAAKRRAERANTMPV